MNGLAVLLDIIEKVNFASGINSDLVARTNAETRVVTRTVVHDTFASGRISLFINRARNRELVPNGSA